MANQIHLESCSLELEQTVMLSAFPPAGCDQLHQHQVLAVRIDIQMMH
jgi:hypothetical protein